MYDFAKAVEEVITECKETGYGRVLRKDKDGYVTLWLEAEWVAYCDGLHDIVILHICYSDTGRIAYSHYIEETLIEKEH